MEHLRRRTRHYLIAEQRRLIASAEQTRRILESSGLNPCIEPHVLHAAFEICEPAESRQFLIDSAREKLSTYLAILPKGLEHLPAVWIKALPGLWQGLCRRFPSWTGAPLKAVGHVQGTLQMVFSQEQISSPDQISAHDYMRIECNRRLYPSLWRPLRKRHERWIWIRYPELRKDLLRVAEVDRMNAIPDTKR